jgi:hypothetical protein
MEPTEHELTIRTGNRERQRLHRKRQKQKRARALEAQRLASERAERMGRGPHFFGESSPGRNANTFADELQIHREFLRALGKEDVQDGETLRTVAKRTFAAWLTGPYTCRSCGPPFYVPAFSRARQQFDPDFGFGIGDAPFETIWTPPKDCTGDELIDVAALPKLPKLSKTKPEMLEPKVEAASPQPIPPAPIPQQQPNAINFAWIPPGGQRYLHGG